ncbi:AAA domain-containing protein, putative AbiEii toxin, Type IV TA system [Maribacter aquivivus]|uniref:AAA domain-containing protein, putative AbiEii toxin, Type IV TA system n=1 Tax=Maribacter aquivivus TaxID=228958 RepID=A0A1M6KV31_9FLAO|nr:ATP-binding protein [Maribacter aquivivus]SHJ62786.1 AAA domain-containing protein, putative AbiEii toxin, Type IV TA system [Maribacter aquivivus]
MKITLQGEYKSLKDLESDDLNKFTVITGKNGSGKSQLLELIKLKSENKLDPLLTFTLPDGINKIQVEGIENRNLTILNNQSWKNKLKPFVDDFLAQGINSRLFFKLMMDKNVRLDRLPNNDIFQAITDVPRDELEKLLTDSLKEFEPQFFNSQRNIQQIASRFIRPQYLSRHKTTLVAKFVSEFKNKDISELNEADFYLAPIPEFFFDNTHLFSSQLEYIFYTYAKRRDLNNRQFFDKQQYGDQNNSDSDDDFIEKFPAPWEKMNSILTRHGIEFQFRGINRQEFSIDTDVKIELVKSSIDKSIEFQHLSSGEKVIIGLIIKLFTSEFYKENLEFPDMIVLDEPDANLHPEMSKLLIDVLNGTFVNGLGINVIFTTHSPSTIALCPEESIYQLQNTPDSKLFKIDKDNALKLLTGFIPTLSIDYKSHKQIFVESPTDRYYFQTIFDRLNLEKSYPFKLYFISNGYGKGNCQQVKDIVDAIRQSDNATCYGVIDWDLKNNSTEFILVHGENSRYNIENYVYDPAYLMILFMEMNALNVRGSIGLDISFNEYTLGSDQDLLQKSIDWFFETYYEKFNVPQEQKDAKREVEYYSGVKAMIPEWYLDFQGHDLEVKLKEAFIALQKFRNEGDLQKELTIISAKCYPMIHMDTVKLMEEIINVG